MRLIARLVLLAVALTLGSVHATEQISAAEAFAELKELAGEWDGKTESGRAIKVSLRLTAADSVLVETWTLGPQRESLTLYHMDDDDLVATHYCPLGNQPRLRLKAPATASLLSFEFVEATNLQDSDAAHQHQFEIEPLKHDSFARSETYLKEGIATTERIVYTRIAKEQATPPPSPTPPVQPTPP